MFRLSQNQRTSLGVNKIALQIIVSEVCVFPANSSGVNGMC